MAVVVTLGADEEPLRQLAASPVASEDSLRGRKSTVTFSRGAENTQKWSGLFNYHCFHLTGHWSGTQPDWCWRESQWWWPVCQWSLPRGWQSWSERPTSGGSRWSLHPGDQWCSRWAGRGKQMTRTRNDRKKKIRLEVQSSWLTSFGMVSSWEPVCAEASIPAEGHQRNHSECLDDRKSISYELSAHLPWKPWLLCAIGKGLCCIASWWSLVSCWNVEGKDTKTILMKGEKNIQLEFCKYFPCKIVDERKKWDGAWKK